MQYESTLLLRKLHNLKYLSSFLIVVSFNLVILKFLDKGFDPNIALCIFQTFVLNLSFSSNRREKPAVKASSKKWWGSDFLLIHRYLK